MKRGARILRLEGDRDGTALLLFRNPDGDHVLVVDNDRPAGASGQPRARFYVKYLDQWLSVPLPYGTWFLSTIVFGGRATGVM